jgi:hypothetical protein
VRRRCPSLPSTGRAPYARQREILPSPPCQLGDVAIVVRRCRNRCLQMLHECTRSCCSRFLEMFQSLSTYVCICVRVAVHDIGVHVCNRFLLSQLLFTDVVLVAYRCCIGFRLMFCMRCNRFSFMLQSLRTCCIRVLGMLQVSHVNVSKLDLNIFDVVNINF